MLGGVAVLHCGDALAADAGGGAGREPAPSLEARLRRCFAAFDSDRSNSLDRAEVRARVRARARVSQRVCACVRARASARARASVTAMKLRPPPARDRVELARFLHVVCGGSRRPRRLLSLWDEAQPAPPLPRPPRLDPSASPLSKGTGSPRPRS